MRARARMRLKERRKKKRLGVCLEDKAITEATRDRYSKAVHEALPYVENSTQTLEEALSNWIEMQYEEGEGITKISDCLSGFHHFLPWCRGKLSKPWRLFKIWRKSERPKQAPPLPEGVLLGLLGRLLECGDLQFAVCLTVAFYGMLRTGELLQLTWNQVLVGAHDVVLQLGFTKTGLRRAVDENVVILNPQACLLIKTQQDIICRLERRGERLWPDTSQKFREKFRSLIRFFQLSERFKPYSLRRGGATADFRAHGSMERTLMRGRWGSTGAARNYVQEGLSALTKLQISPHTATLLKQHASLFL